MFTRLSPENSNIHFINENTDTDTLNTLDYLYYYNGAGVAVGDINNDGLPDIFFASNTQGNKLYLNKGNLKFEDVTEKANIKGQFGWTTGVTMADVNGDGYLDIYICTVSNHTSPNGNQQTYFKNARNQLYINNKDGTFTECARKWGLDAAGYSTQAVFFDYDHDGDLDMFLLQHSIRTSAIYADTSERSNYSLVSGGKLFRNDGDHFTDVTKSSGIISSSLGFGLGVGVSDFNNDGWDDIYVSNDFQENDYYYLNQRNGTFKEINSSSFAHESKSSMGNDIGDINNDGWMDLVTVDMLPHNEKILKSSQTDPSQDIYNFQKKLGYHDQFSRNCLQLNIGEGKKFAEIGLYSGIAATDWSWSPLIADYDLDGFNDIFISNGIKGRLNDLDYINFVSDHQLRANGYSSRFFDNQILQHLPPGKWHNYIFKGSSDLKFIDESNNWGFSEATLSQGAAYADLDNDGDLEIITNNMNEPAGIYKNNSREQHPDMHYLTLQLKGNYPNTFCIGAKAFLFSNHSIMYRELQPERGFLSCSEPLLHFGLGKSNLIDSLIIIWPNNTEQKISHFTGDQKLVIRYKRNRADTILKQENFIKSILKQKEENTFTDITKIAGIDFEYREDASTFEYNHRSIIPGKLLAPALTVGDVNGDSLDDFYIGGGKGQSGSIYLQHGNGSFTQISDSAIFVNDKEDEDIDACFFDADGDKDLDLYVVSGQDGLSKGSREKEDRLYINDGKGNFSKSSFLPKMIGSTGSVKIADYDNDKDNDILLIGGISGTSKADESYLLQNDGKGHFKNVTNEVLPQLRKLGSITDASWVDIDNDGWLDLVVIGQWMEPIVFKNKHGNFVQQELTDDSGKLKGCWRSIECADINGDGFPDILLGNLGLNSKLTASYDFPLKLYQLDVDNNQRTDQIIAIAKNGKYYPFETVQELEKNMPYLKTKYKSYREVAGKTLEQIFGDELSHAEVSEANTLASMILINNKNGKFTAKELPSALQWTPINSLIVDDLNKDGMKDLITGGNFFVSIPYEGQYDAMPLLFSKGNNRGNFSPQFPLPDAFDKISEEVKSIRLIDLANQHKGILIAISNHQVILLEAP
ncbi:MAG TPA: VCBS repeat-containing protein [Hanamia sp.]|nr:VCBS repeat-containing protein [Hanamia sp.]